MGVDWASFGGDIDGFGGQREGLGRRVCVGHWTDWELDGGMDLGNWIVDGKDR